MKTISVRNVNSALPAGIELLLREGQVEDSRNGPVYVYPAPVTTVYSHPTERVLCFKERDANPFFHLFESLWLLAGRNDVEWLAQFNQQMRNYSDDGETFHGAYGYRWRQAFEKDQLESIVRLLQKQPSSRRAVLQIWGCEWDLLEDESLCKDIPCNLMVLFNNRAGALDITVYNRSNDLIWGLAGANAVQFSILQEYIAAKLGWPVGRYYQVSNNYHAYQDILSKYAGLAVHAPDPFRTIPRCWYERGEVKPFRLVQNPAQWDKELYMFIDNPTQSFQELFFEQVAKPLYLSHLKWRNRQNDKRYIEAKDYGAQCQAADWRRAAWEWLNRREEKASYGKADC